MIKKITSYTTSSPLIPLKRPQLLTCFHVYCAKWLGSLITKSYESHCRSSMDLHICWECHTIFRKYHKFRKQVCNVQRQLTLVLDGKIQLKDITSSSRLTIGHTNTLDLIEEASLKEETQENFIDCGVEIKYEDDIDEVPLAHLRHRLADADSANQSSQDETNLHVFIQNSNLTSNLNPKNYINTRQKLNIEVNIGLIDIGSDIEREVSAKEDYLEDEQVENFSAERKEIMDQISKDSRQDSASEVQPQKKKGSLPVLMSKRGRPKKIKDVNVANEFKCKECGEVFDSKNKRWHHVSVRHRGGLQCHYCNKTFPHKFSLEKHHLVHTGAAPREPCKVCNKSIYLYCMKAHLSTHEERQAVKCHVCDRSYKSALSYKVHLKKHEADYVLYKHQCPKCEKRYPGPNELRDHLNYYHYGKTIHKCPVCKKPLATGRSLNRHINRCHRGVKERTRRDNMCHVCGRAFKCVKNLREHERIHSGERPLACEMCGATFRQAASLYTHKKRVHKVFPKKMELELLEPTPGDGDMADKRISVSEDLSKK